MSGQKAMRVMTINAPQGTFTQKTHRQDECVVIAPPIKGPLHGVSCDLRLAAFYRTYQTADTVMLIPISPPIKLKCLIGVISGSMIVGIA